MKNLLLIAALLAAPIANAGLLYNWFDVALSDGLVTAVHIGPMMYQVGPPISVNKLTRDQRDEFGALLEFGLNPLGWDIIAIGRDGAGDAFDCFRGCGRHVDELFMFGVDAASFGTLRTASLETIDPVRVPEPGTLGLMAAGLLALGVVRRRPRLKRDE